MSIDHLLESIREERLAHGRISRQTIVKAMSAGDLRVNCEVVHGLLDSELQTGRVPIDACLELILDTLARCLRGEAEHPDIFSDFEAASYAGRLFQILWRDRRHTGPLQEFQLWLETFLRSANARQRESILLGFLEHVLQDPKVDAYFATWEKDAALSTILAEARQLANGFQNLPSRKGRRE